MIVCADARHIPLPDESVQCVVTSPPYWGLRKYAGAQELVWGGREDCEHGWTVLEAQFHKGQVPDQKWKNQTAVSEAGNATTSSCVKCGAWRGAYGLEPTIEMYVQHTVEILREIRRVLRADGVSFWNIGDSYFANPKGSDKGWDKSGLTSRKDGTRAIQEAQAASLSRPRIPTGCKAKDLCLIPQRVALAAQADGWWVRSDIIWYKPNPMPESVRDRPTDAYEHILMLTKSARYYWDATAVAEPLVRLDEGKRKTPARFGGANKFVLTKEQSRLHSGNPYLGTPSGKRNLRNVWTFATQPFKGAHFATFPEELARRCIKAATKPGDLVLDPFAGSGTTGKVAIELGRRAVLLDLAYTRANELEASKRYENLVRRRIGPLKEEKET